MSKPKRAFRQIALLTFLAGVFCWSEGKSQITGPVNADTSTRINATDTNTPPVAAPVVASPAKTPERNANYVLGPDDQIIIHAFQVQELSERQIQIGGDGYVNLPMVGRIEAGGMTVSAFESKLSARLLDFVQQPQVSVFVSEYRSQPVSVVGSVNIPGVVQLRGRKTLVEVIALAGGLKPEAGTMATITRELSVGRIPLPGATDDPSGQFSIATVNLHNVMSAQSPKENILVDANDVIMIPKAPLLYVVGEVQKPGAYAMTDRNSVTVLQAVALAGGLTGRAAPKKAKILYQRAGASTRTEVPTDVRSILDGKAADIEMHPDDILFVPNNLAKSAGGKALETALNLVGVAIYRF